ncbi:MAG: phage portal protein [Bacteroidales bacterium]|nr:phage portal protein [Bacteroidales bacterium]
MNIAEIITADRSIENIISDLKQKSISVPAWKGGKLALVNQYDPKLHPVMNKGIYPDNVSEDGHVDFVTRVTYNLQRLAVKRMSELCNGVPVKRIYRPDNDRQKKIAKYIERIFERNRINSVNNERLKMLFAGCEVMTLWYAVEDKNHLYGFVSPLKMRCRNFSPMQDDELYPLFDEYGDMIALSVGYQRKVGRETVNYFDTYTADHHYKWSNASGQWTEEANEVITLGKIPAIYMYRPTPIWEDTSQIVYEMEWTMSRNGNYLRKNSKPLFVVFADEAINYGEEKEGNNESRSIVQFPKGSSANYVTWAQAIDNLKFYISELRQSFFTQLQLPDWSYESMKATPMSGESRKQLFIDAQLKVQDEAGRLIEFYDREVNVVKLFLKAALGDAYANDIDALPVESVITPFTITDEKDTITNLVTANGGKPIMSQREAIEEFGHSTDVDKTLEEIIEQSKADSFGLTI